MKGLREYVTGLKNEKATNESTLLKYLRNDLLQLPAGADRAAVVASLSSYLDSPEPRANMMNTNSQIDGYLKFLKHAGSVWAAKPEVIQDPDQFWSATH